MSDTNIIEFIAMVKERLEKGDIIKITLSKPRIKSSELQNIYIKPVIIRDQAMYSAIYHYRTKDETYNYTDLQLSGMLEKSLTENFFFADVIAKGKLIKLMQSANGKISITQKSTDRDITVQLDHDRKKVRMIPENSPFLHLLGLSSSQGKIFDKAQDKYRQINKYVELANQLLNDLPANASISIADMGSGKGYLSFALYDWLVRKGFKVSMTGYDIRKDMVEKCNGIAASLSFDGLNFKQADIGEISLDNTDMVIALHACDIATDMAIAKGIAANAGFIIAAPCCHKQIRKSMKGDNLLSPILKHGILTERQAELITDGIRALLMEASGYTTRVFEFISTEHTAKNLMITGVKGKPNPVAREKVHAIKEFFGISHHHLELLIN